jgi:hypothetical protein
MKSMSCLHYLWLVSSPRRYLCTVLAVVAAVGVAAEFINAGSSESAVVGILLLQMFSASVGMRGVASRGYLDPVLTSGIPRSRVAALHFLSASGPGVAAWLLVGIAAAFRAGTVAVPPLRPGGLVALLLVSAVAWATTLPLPPLTGGAIWLMISLGLVISGKLVWLTVGHGRSDWFTSHPIQGVALGLGFPLFIPSIAWPWTSVAILAAIGVVFVAGGIVYVDRSEFSLVEEG